MSKSPSKSIIGNFGKFLAADPAGAQAATPPSPARPARVGAGVIGVAERSIAQIVEERDRLQALVASGSGGAVDIDASLIDPSPFQDRLPDDDEAAFEAFRRGFEAEGQKVPVQLRRHPDAEGRFQVIYGHRRVRAAQDIGRPVKALILAMSDHDLAIAQGIENSERQDLTWIERALFAWRMEGAGVKARDIRAALSVDDPELARMRAVLRVLPVDVVEAIGRAPKIGRPRWLALSQAAGEGSAAIGLLRQTLSADKVSGLASNERFQRALAAVSAAKAAPAKPPAPDEMALIDGEGRPVAKALFSRKDVRLVMDKQRAAAFTAFLRQELPALVEKFDAGGGADAPA